MACAGRAGGAGDLHPKPDYSLTKTLPGEQLETADCLPLFLEKAQQMLFI